ncbi:MAG: peroxidase-related enzyme [Alphaproteobacteria bacterium]
MAWIRTISYADSDGKLRRLYDRIKGPGDNVDNIMAVHSLRPHTMEAHMTVYKYVLHHSANELSKSFLETVGVYVSLLNDCAYCVEHHAAGLRRLLSDDARSDAVFAALRSDRPDEAFDGAELAMLRYARALTVAPGSVDAAMLAGMREAGVDDGRILELNQVTAYFSYANRTVLGLGVTTEGDIIGLSPNDSDNPDDWSHR